SRGVRRRREDVADGAAVQEHGSEELPERGATLRQARVVGEGAVDLLAARRLCTGVDPADDGLLLRGQAGTVALALTGRHAPLEGEDLLAALARGDDAVLETVESVATGEDRVRDRLPLGRREGGGEVGRGGDRRI